MEIPIYNVEKYLNKCRNDFGIVKDAITYLREIYEI